MHSSNNQNMKVIKRNGEAEAISFDKISNRIKTICEKLELNRVNIIDVAIDTISGLYNSISTEEIDQFAGIKCAEKIRDDPQYDKLATGLCVSRLHKMTSADFLIVTQNLYNNIDSFGQHNPLISDEYYDFVKNNIDILQESLTESYHRDYEFDYFGFKTLERSYLKRIKASDQTNNNIDNKNVKQNTKKEIVERPQHLWMRVAVGLNLHKSLEDVLETFKGLSHKYFIFGSPTLYNTGSKFPQLSSCFLLYMGDSIEGIYDTLKDVALISKRAGGIGICMSDIRANTSFIKGTNGTSSGIVPFIKVVNQTGRAVNQSGLRNGAIAIYVEPWHADIFHFCELRSNKGNEEDRARDIFLALWIPDLFMKRVKEDGNWSLMCPNECPGLSNCYGEEFEKLYSKYESEGKFRKQIKAKTLWFHILTCQVETGMPYMLYKDNVNNKSNQKNIGTIKCSNLCSEIVEFTSPDEISVCTLSSICLPKFVELVDNKLVYNFEKLRYIASLATKNLNNVIDINYYPVEKSKVSNFKHRPIGLGVQGLADVYCMLDLPYDSEEARTLNKKIFETIYFGALQMSVELAKQYGAYDSFAINGGSPFSHGQVQFHLAGLKTSDLLMGFDWDNLISDLQEYGSRNSMLTTVMPTASTSQINGNTEACEPITSLVYTRTTLAGEFVVINKHLANKLISLGLWDQDLKNELLYDKGSIQNISSIPDNIKAIYQTAFELNNKPIVQQSCERQPFIDQSQSLNLFGKVPDFNKLTSSHFYGWSNGLKTGLYYFRSQPAVDALDFGLDLDTINDIKRKRGIMVMDRVEIKEDKISDPRLVSEIEVNHGKRNPNFVVSPCGDSCGA
jgi:ribonucleoside-diphosphate reductase alpha chain